MESSSSTGTKRTHTLMDSTVDTPALCDNLIDKTEKATMDALFDRSSRSIVNEPNRQRALGMCELLASLDNMLGDSPAPWATTTATTTTAAATALAVAAPGADSAGPAKALLDDTAEESGFVGRIAGLQNLAAKPHATPASAPGSTPAAKAVPKVKAKAKSGGKDPKPKPAPKARQSPIESLDPNNIKNPKPPSGGGTSTLIAGQDEAWIAENKASLDDAMDLTATRTGETEFRQDLQECIKKTNTLLSKFRARKRLLKRRSEDTKEPAMSQASDLEHIAETFLDLVRSVSKGAPTAGDEYIAKVEALAGHGAAFGPEMIKRLARLIWLDDHKYQRWSGMLTSTLQFVQKYIPESDTFSSELFLQQQMSLILQKLLKGIGLEVVTWT